MKSVLNDNQAYTFYRMCERYAELIARRNNLKETAEHHNQRYQAALKDLDNVNKEIIKCNEEHERFWREVFGVKMIRIEAGA